jgi:hypothetical protein
VVLLLFLYFGEVFDALLFVKVVSLYFDDVTCFALVGLERCKSVVEYSVFMSLDLSSLVLTHFCRIV